MVVVFVSVVSVTLETVPVQVQVPPVKFWVSENDAAFIVICPVTGPPESEISVHTPIQGLAALVPEPPDPPELEPPPHPAKAATSTTDNNT